MVPDVHVVGHSEVLVDKRIAGVLDVQVKKGECQHMGELINLIGGQAFAGRKQPVVCR